jgi:hypothetical protein
MQGKIRRISRTSPRSFLIQASVPAFLNCFTVAGQRLNYTVLSLLIMSNNVQKYKKVWDKGQDAVSKHVDVS